MATLVDGLGGEELGGLGDTGSKASQIWVTGSVVSEDTVKGAVISGTTAIRGAQAIVAGSILDGDGRVAPGLLGSPTITSGCRIQAGYITMSAGSEVDINLSTSFASQPYVVAFGVSGVDTAATPTISGVQTVSGCTVIGDASAVYSWIAVGAA